MKSLLKRPIPAKCGQNRSVQEVDFAASPAISLSEECPTCALSADNFGHFRTNSDTKMVQIGLGVAKIRNVRNCFPEPDKIGQDRTLRSEQFKIHRRDAKDAEKCNGSANSIPFGNFHLGVAVPAGRRKAWLG